MTCRILSLEKEVTASAAAGEITSQLPDRSLRFVICDSQQLTACLRRVHAIFMGSAMNVSQDMNI